MYNTAQQKTFFFYCQERWNEFRAADSKNDISFPKLTLVFELKGNNILP